MPIQSLFNNYNDVIYPFTLKAISYLIININIYKYI